MKLRLYDTGYHSGEYANSATYRESLANRAGYNGSDSVTYITLNVTHISRNAGNSVEQEPTPANYVQPETNFVSYEGAKYTLNCYLKKNDSTAGYQYNLLTQILRMERTKGIKLIYPSTVTDDHKSIIEVIGAYNAANGVHQGSGKSLPASTPYIAGRCKITNLKDDSKSKIWTFNMEFDCEEELQD